MLHAMIMAGGGGTRFWPRSRRHRPKQFLTVTGDRTLLQMALDRIEATALPISNCWILTAENYREQTHQQLPDLVPEQIVGEPCGRDTAPCIALGAALIHRKDPEATMLVTPADHVIEPVQEFRRAVHVAEQMAHDYPDALITFGIPPTYAATAYGYIHRGQPLGLRQGIGVFRVSDFEEKPEQELADQFFASCEYFWNAGIFLWKTATILSALKKLKPGIHDAVMRIADAWDTPQQKQVLETEYPNIEKISIDYAVMEDHPERLVVQAPYRWDDVGSWLAVERMHPQDSTGNTVLGTHCGINTHDCVIVGDHERLITTIGVKDLLIVQDGDSTLVAHRNHEGTVKQLVEQMRKHGLDRHL